MIKKISLSRSSNKYQCVPFDNQRYYALEKESFISSGYSRDHNVISSRTIIHSAISEKRKNRHMVSIKKWNNKVKEEDKRWSIWG